MEASALGAFVTAYGHVNATRRLTLLYLSTVGCLRIEAGIPTGILRWKVANVRNGECFRQIALRAIREAQNLASNHVKSF